MDSVSTFVRSLDVFLAVSAYATFFVFLRIKELLAYCTTDRQQFYFLWSSGGWFFELVGLVIHGISAVGSIEYYQFSAIFLFISGFCFLYSGTSSLSNTPPLMRRTVISVLFCSIPLAVLLLYGDAISQSQKILLVGAMLVLGHLCGLSVLLKENYVSYSYNRLLFIYVLLLALTIFTHVFFINLSLIHI